jgi:hypothetical protein
MELGEVEELTDTKDGKSERIEVWLRRDHTGVACRVVHENESTETLDVDSLTLAGAEREVTGWFLSKGYTPVDHDWSMEIADSDGTVMESMRRFQRKG